jgi:DNA-binding NtrC family response regulator
MPRRLGASRQSSDSRVRQKKVVRKWNFVRSSSNRGMQPPARSARRSGEGLVAAEQDVSHSRPPVSALVVDGTLADALPTVALLVDYQFHVTVADTFARAKSRLAESPPALLITEIRLQQFNGLQLVLHGKSLRPGMAALVLSRIADPVLQADAEALGATFVVKPVGEKELLAAAFRTLMRNVTDEASEPITPPFERRAHQRRSMQLPTHSERRRTERRRDLASLMASAADLR